jgi:leader peptidase (prepilin peptidase)/N-methyltransferase
MFLTLSDARGALFQPNAWLLAALLGLCVAIAAIDWRRQIIPNACNTSVACLGLVYASSGGMEGVLWSALQGAIAFGLFWLVRRIYRAIRPVHGLGLGDVKFLGAAGTWIGLEGIAPMILVACVSALAFVGITMLRGQKPSARHPIPFGPFLALGLIVVLGFSPD